MREFGYIIGGGGSAGCVLAERLGACGRHQVLLLEAGPSDRRFWAQVPIGYGVLFQRKAVNWMYGSQPEPEPDGRVVCHPRGKLLGGSGSINALVYHRGQAGDYDGWAAAGNAGWSYDDVADDFAALETGAGMGDGAPHLTISDNSDDFHNMGRDFVDICRQGRLAVAETPLKEGAGVTPYLTTTRNGFRCSSAKAFLRPVMKRPNLHVVTGAEVGRIRFDGRRAAGVRYCRRGVETEAQAAAEIIPAAGAVGSPQILQFSGVGDARHLQSIGVEAVHNSPRVGRHLQDHYGVNYIFKANRPTLNDAFGNRPGRVRAMLQYVVSRRGPMALGVNRYGGLVKTSESLARPDMQIYLNPVSCQALYKGRRVLMKPEKFSGFITGFNSCRPKGEGSVTITSPRAADAPAIRPNCLSHPDDQAEALAMARLVERPAATPALRSLLADDPPTPLADMDDEAVLADFRQRGGTVFHLCGTCRTGPDAETSVVDPRLRVHGIDGLRVCDASAFPGITSANINAPTMMLARRAAGMILEDAAR